MRRKNHYSCSEFIGNVYSVLLTKLFYPQCRLIRRPVVVRGKQSIVGGNRLTIGKNCRFDLEGSKKTLQIGDNCEFGDNTHIVALNKVIIGNNVLIASKVFISDCSHGCYSDKCGRAQDSPVTPPNERELVLGAVTIGDNVWIGENATILMDVTIGSGCIIGANSVITRDVPDNCIVAGNNEILKKYNQEKQCWERV